MTTEGQPHLLPRSVAAEPVPPTLSAEERELVDAVLDKDRKAAAEFVERYSDSVYGYVRQRLAPRADLVDDLVQDVFIAALKGLPRFRGSSSLRGWLVGIARHKVEDYYRTQIRQMRSLSDVDDDSGGMPVLSPHLDEAIDRSRLEQKTRRVLAQLPEPYGLVLLWRYWEKRSAREMAEGTGKTEKAIERLLARARSQFKRHWMED